VENLVMIVLLRQRCGEKPTLFRRGDGLEDAGARASKAM
jgi:hypothetical protein